MTLYADRITHSQPRSQPVYGRWSRPGAANVADIVGFASRLYGVTVDELTGESRRQPLVWYRQLAMAAARELTPASYPTIADVFGGRDHTTVIYSCRKWAGTVDLAQLCELLYPQANRGSATLESESEPGAASTAPARGPHSPEEHEQYG